MIWFKEGTADEKDMIKIIVTIRLVKNKLKQVKTEIPTINVTKNLVNSISLEILIKIEK